MSMFSSYISGAPSTIVSDITSENWDNNTVYSNQVLSRFITQALNMVKSGIINNMSRKKKIASGLTTQSLRVVRDTPQSGFVASDSRGLEFTQTGRSPGRVPKNFEAIIRRWITDKGIVPHHVEIKNRKRARLSDAERDLKRAAHNIKRSIERKGTLQKRQGWTNIYTHEISRAKVWLRTRVAQETMLSLRKFYMSNK